MKEQQNISPTSTKPKRTAEAEEILDTLARLRGRELTEHEANLALAQARQIGELQDGGPVPPCDVCQPPRPKKKSSADRIVTEPPANLPVDYQLT